MRDATAASPGSACTSRPSPNSPGIAAEFGLHPLAVEDAVHAHQRPKLERYDDTLFTVFKTIHYVEHAELTATSEVVETGEVMCFTGRDFFITVRHGGQGSLRALRHRLQDDPELLAKGPSAVLHAIADHVVDGYLAVADAMQDDIDEVEIEVFSQHAARAPARHATPGGSTSSSVRCWSSSGRWRRCCGPCSC